MNERDGRKLAWKKDPYDGRDYLFKPRYAAPEKVDLSGILPAVRDQGSIGACVGFAMGGYLGGLALRDRLWVDDFSPTWIYNGARYLEGMLPYDVGCYPRNALRWLLDKGGLLERYWPYHPYLLDKTPPPSSLESEAAKRPLASYERVTGGAEGTCGALADGHLVAIGTPWYDSWMYVGKDGRLPEVSALMAVAGGHATLLYGYDKTLGVFFGQNSWGTTWGNKGRFLMPMSTFSVFGLHGGYDAHVINVAWAQAPDDPAEPEEPEVPVVPGDDEKPKTWVWVLAALGILGAVILLMQVCG